MDGARLIRRASRVLLVLLLAFATCASAAHAARDARLEVRPGAGTPSVLNQEFSYDIVVGNTGDDLMDGMLFRATVPVEMTLTHVTTGAYTGLAGADPGIGVWVYYATNTSGSVFRRWGGSPNTTTDETLSVSTPPLGSGEYINRVMWIYGQAAPGMQAVSPPTLRGHVTNPDKAGGPVTVGDTITSCASLTASYVDEPYNVTKADCGSFDVIAGPGIGLRIPHSTPLGSATRATAHLSGGAPTGSLTFQVFAASDTDCATPLLTEDVPANGAGDYVGPAFPAAVAGTYQWVVRYNGDSLHAPSATLCTALNAVFAVVAPPDVSADFGAEVIDVGASTPLTLTITNPAPNTVPLTGVALAITLPDGLTVATPNGASSTCGGAVTAPAGSRSIALAGGGIREGSSCTFSVDVTGVEPGPATVTTGAVGSANGGAGGTATAALVVRAASATALTCGEAVTIGDEVTCTATASAAFAPAGTVSFASDATGTFSADACTLEPIADTKAACNVRYAPSGSVPDVGRHDRLTAEYAPADTDTWMPSAGEVTVAVRARPNRPVMPNVPSGPQSARELALSCSPARLVLLSARQSRKRVRFRGAAGAADAGQRVTIRTARDGAVAAHATVRPDGSFAATGRAPARRAVNQTRYYVELGERHSAALKLTRRLTAGITASARTITIRGRVSPPLGKPVRPVVIRRVTSCGSGTAVAARVRPNARGRFRVSLPRTVGPALYRAQTRVRTRHAGGGTFETFALVLGADPAR
jgi:hypothetical protein